MFNKIIKQIGLIPLDSVMDFALNEFYNKQNIIDKSGHFVTSPEVSSVFGEIIATFLLDYILKNNIDKIRIVEIGGGNGTLLTDILHTIEILGYKNKIYEYICVEKSKSMQNIQKNKLPSATHLSNLETIPTNLPIMIISNEFLDALPIKQFVCKQNKWYEIFVGLQNDKFVFMQSNDATIIEIKGKENDILELPIFGMEYFKEMCDKIEKSNGLMLTIDYGFIGHTFGSTIQAIKNHQKVDFLENIGNCDVTHLVQFDFFKKIANKFNLKTNFLNQHDFLIQNHILKRANNESVQRLINKEENGMGNFIFMINNC